MAFASVYDQVIIQSVFNVISPILELTMHQASYGYRCNLTDPKSNQIFQDWRSYYPSFRNSVLDEVRTNPNGVHVCCDIKGYYDHIDHEILVTQLNDVIHEQMIIDFLKNVVALWNTGLDSARPRGLPQGPAYARVLANLYLNQFDVFASGIATGYFRYVDDFYLLFDSSADAERGLQEIANHLHALGLSLSDDEKKRPRITSNSDESIIAQSLDKIQYGILEETKHLSHLDQDQIEDFYKAVQRSSAPLKAFEDIVDINNALPSHLYSASQDITTKIDYKKKIFKLTEYLVSENWFCPKNLKKLFYRLIPLIPDNDERLLLLFQKLHPTHKVYFLLSLLGLQKQTEQFEILLRELVEVSLSDQNPFVYGMGIAIATSQRLDYPASISEFDFAIRCVSDRSYFAISKWLGPINVFALESEIRKLIRDSEIDRENELIRLSILRNLSAHDVSPSLLDEKYVAQMIARTAYFGIIGIADYLSTLGTTSDSFNASVTSIVADPRRKRLAIRRLKSAIYDKQSSERAYAIENLRVLYAEIGDEELQRELLGAIARISQTEDKPHDSFERNHVMVEHYNECMLFTNLSEGDDYKFVEVIPIASVADLAYNDISDLINRLEDLSAKGIVSTSTVEVDVGLDELRIKYVRSGDNRSLDSSMFSIEKRDSIITGLKLASQIYKKALYYRRVLSSAPRIALDNLLVNEALSNILFRTVGKSLSARFVISDNVFTASEADISAQIGQLLGDLFYESGNVESSAGGNGVEKTEIEVFLISLLQNLSAKDPSKRYSFSRFEYLVDQLSIASASSRLAITDLFLVERLKSALYRRNTESPTWRGICAAADDHIADVLHAVPQTKLMEIAYQRDVFSHVIFRRRLHVMTRELLDLQSNYGSFLAGRESRKLYLDLASAILGLAVVSTETFCAYRSIENKRPRAELVKLLESPRLEIGTEECSKSIRRHEVAQIVAALGRLTTERDEFEPIHLSLGEIGIVLLVSVFSYEKRSDYVQVIRPSKLDPRRFVEMVNICLHRLPNVEGRVCELVELSKAALRNGEEVELDVQLEELSSDIRFICGGLYRILKLQQIRRRSGILDTRMWPPDVICKRRFGRTRYAKNEAISHLPLTNRFPSRQTKSSWDSHKKKIRTLVVPGDRLHKLVGALKKGKFFGRKLSYLYSGRTMLVWDLVLSLIVSIAFVVFDYKANLSSDQTLGSLSALANLFLGAVLLGIVGKIILVDLKYWVTDYHSVVEWIRKA